jgi:Uncharacterised nucleotidyltransferase
MTDASVYAGPLAAALPTSGQTRLLRVCLLSAEAARANWEEWLRGAARPGDRLRDPRGGFKRLLAFLGYRLREQHIEVDAGLRGQLRAARVREQLRADAVRDVCRSALAALSEAGVQAVVLRGVMAAGTLYPDPSLRHCHDLDLLVSAELLEAAARVLEAEGCSRVAPRLFRHASGFPICLHQALFRIGAFNTRLDDVAGETVPAIVAGAQATLLTPAANLLHLCGHAVTTGSHVTPNWAVDAWLLLDRHPELRWEAVVDWASRGALAGPLAATLGYLAGELDAGVPPGVLGALAAAAARQPRRPAWFAALRSAEGRPLALLQASRGLDRCRAFVYLARRAAGLLKVS